MSRFHGLCRGCLERRYQQVGCNRAPGPLLWALPRLQNSGELFWGRKPANLIPLGPLLPFSRQSFHTLVRWENLTLLALKSSLPVIRESPLLISTRQSGPSECWDRAMR